jgi:hypothetical protein
LLALALSGPVPTSNAQSVNWNLSSPNGALNVAVFQSAPTPDAPTQLFYQIQLRGVTVINPSPLGAQLFGDTNDFVGNLALRDVRDVVIDETYRMPSGKRAIHRNYANEKTLTFANSAGQMVDIIFRAYDDGIAYRYHFHGAGLRDLMDETTGFSVPPGATAWMQLYMPFYENFYTRGVVGRDFTSGHYAFPALYTTQGAWVMLTEAAVNGNYAASRLVASGTADGVFRLGHPDMMLSATLPWVTPWRVAIIGQRLSDVVESVLVDNLNPPAESADTSWIRPGRVAWSWWSDSDSPRSLPKQRSFVDLAQAMGWEYMLVDEGWDSRWIPDLVTYANPRGVGVLLWARWTDLDTPDERAALLPLWKSWGIKGIKVDFMNSDSQTVMAFYDDISRATFEQRLMINFHGATIPRGQRRQWPHIMTYEAVRGAEYYKFRSLADPTTEHTTTLPFTRNVVGPMDYTPVTFSARERITTAAHELALAVVFESGLQHFADAPRFYTSSVGRPFLSAVPARWDETRLLDGYPGEFAVVARRHGDVWYIGAINAGAARNVSLSLAFLDQNRYAAYTYRDGANANEIIAQQGMIDPREPLMLNLPPNGGFAACLVADPVPIAGLPLQVYLPIVAGSGPPPVRC